MVVPWIRLFVLGEVSMCCCYISLLVLGDKLRVLLPCLGQWWRKLPRRIHCHHLLLLEIVAVFRRASTNVLQRYIPIACYSLVSLSWYVAILLSLSMSLNRIVIIYCLYAGLLSMRILSVLKSAMSWLVLRVRELHVVVRKGDKGILQLHKVWNIDMCSAGDIE